MHGTVRGQAPAAAYASGCPRSPTRSARPTPTATSAPAAGSAWPRTWSSWSRWSRSWPPRARSAAAGRSRCSWWAPSLLGLPFGVAGYRLSRAFGLSRQTPAGWLADRLKGAGVGLVLGAIAAGGLLGIQRAAGGWWPLPAWLAIVAFSALLAALWPVLLLPIFLRSEPMSAGALADELWETARRAQVHVRELRLLKMGEKTAAANAMVAGLGRPEDLRVRHPGRAGGGRGRGRRARPHARVLAHELGHHVHHDIWRLLTLSAATLAVGVLGMWAAIEAFAPPAPATSRRSRRPCSASRSARP